MCIAVRQLPIPCWPRWHRRRGKRCAIIDNDGNSLVDRSRICYEISLAQNRTQLATQLSKSHRDIHRPDEFLMLFCFFVHNVHHCVLPIDHDIFVCRRCRHCCHCCHCRRRHSQMAKLQKLNIVLRCVLLLCFSCRRKKINKFRRMFSAPFSLPFPSHFHSLQFSKFHKIQL